MAAAILVPQDAVLAHYDQTNAHLDSRLENDYLDSVGPASRHSANDPTGHVYMHYSNSGNTHQSNPYLGGNSTLCVEDFIYD